MSPVVRGFPVHFFKEFTLMTIVPLRSIPPYERHLLFCTRLTPRQRRYRPRRRFPQLAAINRSLRVHGDPVPSTWPAKLAEPIEALAS
jgi:hypothetical protein